MSETVKLTHNLKKVSGKREIGSKAYIFTSWGLVLGTIVKERIDKYTGVPQYKFDVKIDANNPQVSYSFWYTTDQMGKSKFTAIFKELVRPLKVRINNLKK